MTNCDGMGALLFSAVLLSVRIADEKLAGRHYSMFYVASAEEGPITCHVSLNLRE